MTRQVIPGADPGSGAGGLVPLQNLTSKVLMRTWFLLFYLRYNQSLLSYSISLLFPFLIIILKWLFLSCV